MRINDFIFKIKSDKNINDTAFANALGENVNWVEDFKDDEDELNGLSILQYKKLCELLDIGTDTVFKITISNLDKLSFSELIRTRREEKYWTIDNLADRIGYENYIIEALENDDLGKICFDALKKVAVELELPIEFIMNKLK